MTDDTLVQAHCNGCSRLTRHRVVASHIRRLQDEIEDVGTFEESHLYQILECLGCEEVVVLHTAEHEAYGEADPTYYPPSISRPMPRWKGKLPVPLQSMLREVYGALQSDSPRLAAMGARTVLDLVLTDKVGDVGTFPEKLAALEKQGFVGARNRKFLSAALDAGSAAAHRGLAPNNEVLLHVMDIVENLLEAVYALEDAAELVRLAIPPRPPKHKPPAV